MTLLNKKIYIPGMDISTGTGMAIVGGMFSATAIVFKVINSKTANREEHPTNGLSNSLLKVLAILKDIEYHVKDMAPHFLVIRGKTISTHDDIKEISHIVKRNGDKIEGIEFSTTSMDKILDTMREAQKIIAQDVKAIPTKK